MENFVQQALTGLATGGIYASLALALVMIYQTTELVNFAQGEMAMFSTYLAWTGGLNEGLQLSATDLPSEMLHPWLGPDLVHAGGRLSGELRVSAPLEREGTLRGEGIPLLAGYDRFTLRRVMIAGGSAEAEYLARVLAQHNVECTILDRDRRR